MKCVGLLIARYALIPSPTEHIFLRDAAVTQIGNPWLRKAVWDAEVVDTEGLPNNLAREMVCSWLKSKRSAVPHRQTLQVMI
jgi:hypothetical protein